jgi:hypothetical protein
MQQLHFNDDTNSIFCPVTGQEIFGVDGLNEPESIIGYWHSWEYYEPVINNEELASKWEQYKQSQIVDEDEFSSFDFRIEQFIESLDDPENYLLISLEQSGFACGPVRETYWFLIDIERAVAIRDKELHEE